MTDTDTWAIDAVRIPHPGWPCGVLGRPNLDRTTCLGRRGRVPLVAEVGEYAKSHFHLDYVPKGGVSLRDQYEQVEKQIGKAPPELQNLPILPECAETVWGYFFELSGKRTIGMSMNPITWGDIDAWSRCRGIRLMQWEIDCITAIDEAFRDEMTPKE